MVQTDEQLMLTAFHLPRYPLDPDLNFLRNHGSLLAKSNKLGRNGSKVLPHFIRSMGEVNS